LDKWSLGTVHYFGDLASPYLPTRNALNKGEIRMEFKQCIKCNNDLPFSAATNEIVCSFCGATNTIENKKFKLKKMSPVHSDDSSSILLASINSDSGSDG